MQTPKPKEEIAKLNFDGTTSRVFTYLGRVYVTNSNDFNDWHYHLPEENFEWLISYIQKHQLRDVPDDQLHNYLGAQNLIRTDVVLRRLIGVSGSASNQEYQIAVSASPTARAWAQALRKAKDSVDWWFANGCPLEEKDLNQVIKWSKQEGWSNEVVASRSIATTILRIRRKKTEMESSSDTR